MHKDKIEPERESERDSGAGQGMATSLNPRRLGRQLVYDIYSEDSEYCEYSVDSDGDIEMIEANS